MRGFGNNLKRVVRWNNAFLRKRATGFVEWSRIKEIFATYEINCVLDVGANRGQYAKNLRRIGYQGYIRSFEPIPYEYSKLSTTMRGDSKWRGYDFALGREKARLTFNVTDDFSEASSFLNLKDQTMKVSQIEVDIINLDSIFDEVIEGVPEPRIFLKLDTQGFDLEVVKGASRCIDKIVGLQSEISINPIYDGMPHFLESLETYERIGFRLVGLFEVFKNEESGAMMEMNCLMVRP